MSITPAMAVVFLRGMGLNRSIRRRSVLALAADMREGRWIPTHQGIAFDKSGKLIDGQHRMLAVIESGVTVRMLVTQGLDEEAMSAIDIGRARDCRDVAVIVGATDDPRHGTWTRAVITALMEHQPSPATVAEAVRPLRPHLDAVSAAFGSVKGHGHGKMRAGIAGAFAVAHAKLGARAAEMARRVYANDALVINTGLWWCRRAIDEGRGGGEAVVKNDARRILRGVEIEMRGTPVKCFRGEPDLDGWRAALPEGFKAMFEIA